MNLEEAKDWMKLKGSDACPKGYPEKWYEAFGFLKGHHSRDNEIKEYAEKFKSLKSNGEKLFDEYEQKIEKLNKEVEWLVKSLREICTCDPISSEGNYMKRVAKDALSAWEKGRNE